MRAHLKGCAQCQGTLQRVEAIQRALGVPAPEPDELSWRRMEARLEHQIRASEQSARYDLELPPSLTQELMVRGPRGATVDIIRGRRGLLAGVVAAAVVGIFIAVFPRRPVVEGRRVAGTIASAEGGAAVVHSGSAPLEVELASGHRLDLTPGTEMSVAHPDESRPVVQLDYGQIDVWAPGPVDRSARLIVRTPELSLWAHSRDFTVAYVAAHRRVDVRDGFVAVEGTDVRVKKGESRDLRPLSKRIAAEPPIPFINRLASGGNTPAEGTSSTAKSGRRTSAQKPRAAAETAAGPAKRKVRPSPPRSRTAGEGGRPRLGAASGRTEVEALEPALSPRGRAWERARQAWYADRDPAAAIEHAREALALEPPAGERVRVLELICDAQVSLRSGAAALQDCSQLLEKIGNSDRKRRVHYTLGTVYRDQLDDCESAVGHYDQALVFGAKSRFNDVVRLRRAECALELGDLETARLDLDRLSLRSFETQRLSQARRQLEELEGRTTRVGVDAE